MEDPKIKITGIDTIPIQSVLFKQLFCINNLHLLNKFYR